MHLPARKSKYHRKVYKLQVPASLGRPQTVNGGKVTVWVTVWVMGVAVPEPGESYNVLSNMVKYKYVNTFTLLRFSVHRPHNTVVTNTYMASQWLATLFYQYYLTSICFCIIKKGLLPLSVSTVRKGNTETLPNTANCST